MRKTEGGKKNPDKLVLHTSFFIGIFLLCTSFFIGIFLPSHEFIGIIFKIGEWINSTYFSTKTYVVLIEVPHGGALMSSTAYVFMEK